MKVNKEEWRQMMGLADADERGSRGLPRVEADTVDHPDPREDIEKAIWYLQRYLETTDDNT